MEKDSIALFSTASPLFFKISATVTTVAIAVTITKERNKKSH